MGSEAYEKIKAGLEEALVLAEAEQEKEARELATSEGFTYWPGGVNPPADWDGGELLFRSGVTWRRPRRASVKWSHESSGLPRYAHIIGYHKKPGEPLWEPLSSAENYAIRQALWRLVKDDYTGLARTADKLYDALTNGGRRLGVTCDPV
ncbi:hypothetical protein [Sphingopyxis flava]|uniref:Uncharacterized protein n=1 Tax=Sphingopyxis flava TaxID=1507287 RepID=A0A1T5BT34_9SPHN|nr:hypothetical protein [Sphingopyxis flava]SKB50030.1 hypothetical protein SAMN06295937_100796 [Sphingopyxis flava]